MKELFISIIFLLLTSNANATTSLYNWQTGEEWTIEENNRKPARMPELHCGSEKGCRY